MMPAQYTLGDNEEDLAAETAVVKEAIVEEAVVGENRKDASSAESSSSVNSPASDIRVSPSAKATFGIKFRVE
jgi:hypothetical protein